MKKIIILFLIFNYLLFSGFAEGKLLSANNSIQFSPVNSKITQREQALPLLDLKSDIETGKLLLDISSELPVKYKLSNRSSQIVTAILNNIYKDSLPELNPIIRPEDLITSQNGEEYQLKRILQSDFKEGNWAVAYKLFTNFLSVDHSEKIKRRAHYYRAQVLFFQNKFREAFMEFTLAGDDKEIQPWIDTLLDYLHKLAL